jgi:hypothetical protein
MPDRYLLRFWTSAPAPDRAVEQTTQTTAYRHDHASGPAERT